jgi:subtilisin family serine protease
VIIGVVDSGIDWCHPDFIDDTTGKSRILFLWDQNLTAQTDEAAADVGTDGNGANNYGVEYTAAHIDAARDANDCARAIEERAVRSADIIGHGTHVAGIAAGDGSATNGASPEEPAGTYQGVAPKADLIVVNLKGDELGPFSESASTVDAVAYIFAKARAAGKPAVINISLGGHDGPVDGTSLLDQAIRNAAGPGRVIVAAAGNEGAAPIHAQGTISPGGSDTVEINFSGCGAPDCEGGIINLWHAGGDAYAVTVTAPNGHSLSAPGGTRRSAVLDGAQVELFNATSSPSNGDKNILLFLDGRGTGDFVWLLTLQRTASGGSGRWDAWSLPDQGEVAFNIKHLPRNSDNSFSGTISEPATSHGAIAVGAHTTKFRWGPGKASPTAFEDFGKISLFSSGGPTRDGRIKPDVTAPGFVVSSTSADCSGLECPDSLSAFDGRHSINAGTSMSTPIVTGAAALILQTDPNSFPRSFLKSTAVRDSFTGADLPNNVWGSGKANLASSAFQVLQANRPPTVSLGGSPAEGFATSSMTFTASASDPDTGDSISEYLWDFESDGATDAITTGNTAGKNFTVAGSYTVTVTAVDQRGKSASATTPITITAPSSDGGGGGGGGCFIATAAYGSYLDPHVETLRNFRDEVLLESAWGRRFVDFYYGWSPAAARFIAGRPLLRGASRLALTPIVFAVGSPRRALWVFIGGWLALGAVLLRLRRR